MRTPPFLCSQTSIHYEIRLVCGADDAAVDRGVDSSADAAPTDEDASAELMLSSTIAVPQLARMLDEW